MITGDGKIFKILGLEFADKKEVVLILQALIFFVILTWVFLT